jgi:ribosomal protein L16 Arg81 hydroxylase
VSVHLARLIDPISPQDFFERYWEKECLHVTGCDSRSFSWLFSLEDLDHLIGRLPRDLKIKVAEARDGRTSTSTLDAGMAGLGSLYDSFCEGRTVIVDGVHRYWEPVTRLCRDLQEETAMETQANLYVTPRGGSGFSCHWDGHDVLVLQLDGKKRWRLHPGAAILPRPSSSGDAYEGEPAAREVTLAAGDVLYIPRGTPHQASALDEPSVHLTVGLMAVTWEDLFTAAIRRAGEKNACLRKSLPIGWSSAPERVRAQAAAFREMVAGLFADSAVDDAVDLLGAQWVESAPCLPDGHFLQLESSADIRLDSTVRRKSGAFLRIVREGDEVKLIFPGGFVGGPAKLHWALTYMAGVDTFQVKDIPGWYSDDERLLLVRLLVRKGFLRILPRQPAAPENHSGEREDDKCIPISK